MTITRIKTGATEPIRVYAVDKKGVALTGLSDLFMRVERESDNFFYDFADATFKSSGWTTKEQVLAEVDATNLAGTYEIAGGLDFSAITNKVANDDYTVYPLQTPGTDARLPAPGVIQEGDWVDEALAMNQFESGAVWIDFFGGTAGTAFPIGTIGTPSNNVNDAKTIALANGRTKFKMGPSGLQSLTQAFDLWIFESSFGATFDINNQSVIGTLFRNCTITGTIPAGSAVNIEDGVIATASGPIGFALRTQLQGTIGVPGSFEAIRCFTRVGFPAVLDYTTGGTGWTGITDWQGGDITLDNLLAGATAQILVSGTGKLTINASCVAGTVTVRGDIEMVDNSSAGCTVNDERNPIPLLSRTDFLALS
jgi:hypothetical protein